MLGYLLKSVSRAISSSIMLMMLTVYFMHPSYYRILTPQFFGMIEIAPNIYSDLADNVPEIQLSIARAERNSISFFGFQDARPLYIVCQTRECDAVFGNPPLGLTLAFHRVLISSEGNIQRVFNHERIHVDLHALMGFLDLYYHRFPMWFNEGLAEYLGGNGCSDVRINQSDVIRVMQANSILEWRALVSDQRYARHYGAACVAVLEIAQLVGRSGLRTLVLSAQNRQQFLNSLPTSVFR